MKLAKKVALKTFSKAPEILNILRNIKSGQGAVRLPQGLTSIRLDLGKNSENAKLFWKEYLPKLAYNNESIDIVVNSEAKTGKDSIGLEYLDSTRSVFEIEPEVSHQQVFHKFVRHLSEISHIKQ